MGMLLRFSPKAPRSASSARTVGPAGARVLLFTGVRYERIAEAEKPKPVRRPRVSRKG